MHLRVFDEGALLDELFESFLGDKVIVNTVRFALSRCTRGMTDAESEPIIELWELLGML